MSRDMKPKRQPTAQNKSRGGTLLGMFIGLVLGVCIAAGVVWYMNKASMPFNKTPVTNAPPPIAKPGAPAQPLALPGKPGDPAPEKRFQFYDILPGKSDAIPDPKAPEVKEPKKEESKETKKDEPKLAAFLQAGSFTNAQDADNQKAKLALMGVEASVQQVMVQDKTFYRVRLGPFGKMEELNKVRLDLAKAGVDASLVKKEQ